MIIIPERRAVLITPPRTGSTFLWQAVKRKYPDAWRPYRHMEADGVPAGYDSWTRIGVFRPPLARLWSLFNYCRKLPDTDKGTEDWRWAQYAGTTEGFSVWLRLYERPFTGPYADGLLADPFYLVKHCLPEQRKSLKLYLRPDLGTRVLWLEQVVQYLGLEGSPVNSSGSEPPPELSKADERHLWSYFAWDLATIGHGASPR